MNFNKTLFWSTLAVLAILETLSLAAYHFHSPILQMIGFAIVFLGTLAVSLRSIEYGVLIAFAELFIGSFGHVFKIDIGPVRMSIRVGLFFAIQIAYNIMLITHYARNWTGNRFFSRLHTFFQKGLRDSVILTSFFRGPYFYPNLALFGALVIAVVVGIVNKNGAQNILHDADAYVVFAYFPIVWAALRHEASRARLATVFTASLTWLVAQTSVVLFVFAHRLREPMHALYLWIRDARIGEITLVAGDFYRIFFQSYIYALISVFIFAIILIFSPSPFFGKNGEGEREGVGHGVFWLFASSIFLLLVSFSRSFWFGGFIGLIVFVFTTLSLIRANRRIVLNGFLKLGGGMLIAIVSLFILVNFPLPPKGPPILLADLFAGRASSLFGEAAATSRWNLLPVMWDEIKKTPILGAGFGKTITYTTTDPRILAEDPTGKRTTFAFEWGYLDLWLKLGIPGLLAFGWLIIRILRRGLHTIKKLPITNYQLLITYGLWLGTIALLAAHFFTPYLNHPLGIGALIVAAAWFEPPQS